MGRPVLDFQLEVLTAYFFRDIKIKLKSFEAKVELTIKTPVVDFSLNSLHKFIQ